MIIANHEAMRVVPLDDSADIIVGSVDELGMRVMYGLRPSGRMYMCSTYSITARRTICEKNEYRRRALVIEKAYLVAFAS